MWCSSCRAAKTTDCLIIFFLPRLRLTAWTAAVEPSGHAALSDWSQAWSGTWKEMWGSFQQRSFCKSKDEGKVKFTRVSTVSGYKHQPQSHADNSSLVWQWFAPSADLPCWSICHALFTSIQKTHHSKATTFTFLKRWLFLLGTKHMVILSKFWCGTCTGVASLPWGCREILMFSQGVSCYYLCYIILAHKVSPVGNYYFFHAFRTEGVTAGIYEVGK